jgi:hypothetical protein
MKRFLPLALAALLLSACTDPSREVIAREVAGKRLPTQSVVRAGDFAMLSFVRIDQRGAAAQVYIEGEDLSGDAEDPTPANPVALRMATVDAAPNVIWLARPCQYHVAKDCPKPYFGAMAFAPEVVAAYNTVLDDLKEKYSLQGYVLNGYKGGGTLAVLAAAGRSDVLGIRTVSSLLNHEMPRSLDPSDWAAKLEKVPQRHFSGKDDPLDNFGSYQAAVSDDICLHHAWLDITGDWTPGWKDQLALPLTCSR